MDFNKEFIWGLSLKQLFWIGGTLLSVVGPIVFTGITTYNKMVSVIESYDESKVKELEFRINAQETRTLKAIELAYEANGSARETSALARGSQREVDAALSSVRSEVKAQVEGLNQQMKALNKAMTNPIGN
jgi:hypothetical protein